MEKVDLADLKSEIRSLLVSSPVGLGLNEFLRDYCINIGKPFPFGEYGYLNPLEFLLAMPDVVQIVQNFRGVKLLPVVAQKSAHVNELVVKQRSNNKNGRNRRSYKSATCSPNSRTAFYKSYSEPAKDCTKSSECFTKDVFLSQSDQLSAQEKTLEVDSMGKGPKNINGSSSWSLNKDLTVELSQNGEDKITLPDRVRQNIREILEEHSEGLLLSRFPQKYKERFLAPFSSQDYGLKSVKELVLALPSIFRHEKYKVSNDWLLFDARKAPQKSATDNDKWIPGNILENMRRLVNKFPNGLYGNKVLELYQKKFKTSLDIKAFGFESIGSFLVFCQSVDCKQEEDEIVVFPKKVKKEEDETFPPAVPPMDELSYMWERYYSEDICNLWFKYEPFQLPPGPFKFLSVKVVDVQNPYNIWMQNINKLQVVNDLMNELNVFYNELEAHYVMDSNTVRNEHTCVVQFSEDKRWHRAIITKVTSPTHVQILYVDYGTDQTVPVSNLRYLHKKFSGIPIQVIKGEMADLTWPEDQNCWPKETNEYICDLSLNKALTAEIVRIHIHEPKLEIILYDTLTTQELCINDLLLRNGYAIHSSVYQAPDSSDLETDKELNDTDELSAANVSFSGSEEIYDEKDEQLESEKESSRSYSFNGDFKEEIESIVSSLTTENDSDLVPNKRMTSTPDMYQRKLVDSSTITDQSFTVDESCQTNINLNHTYCLQEAPYNYAKPVASNAKHLVVQQTFESVRPVHNEEFNLSQDPFNYCQSRGSSLRSAPGLHTAIPPDYYTQLYTYNQFRNARINPPPGFEALASDSITSFSSRLNSFGHQLAEISAELLLLKMACPQLQMQEQHRLQKQHPMQSVLPSPSLSNFHRTVPNSWDTQGLQTQWVSPPYQQNQTQSYNALPKRNTYSQGLPNNDFVYHQGGHMMNSTSSSFCSSTVPCATDLNLTPVYRYSLNENSFRNPTRKDQSVVNIDSCVDSKTDLTSLKNVVTAQTKCRHEGYKSDTSSTSASTVVNKGSSYDLQVNQPVDTVLAVVNEVTLKCDKEDNDKAQPLILSDSKDEKMTANDVDKQSKSDFNGTQSGFLANVSVDTAESAIKPCRVDSIALQSHSFTTDKLNDRINRPVSKCLEPAEVVTPDGTSGKVCRPKFEQSVQPPRWHRPSPKHETTNKRIKHVVVLDRYLHVFRKGLSLYVLLDQLTQSYTPFTTKLIIDYRLQNIKQDLQLTELTAYDYPNLFAELKMTNIFGVKRFCHRLTVIPVKKTLDFLIALVPENITLVSAFKQFQKWEHESLHTFYDIMKDT